MPVEVLFVCLGNICRSPTAHGVFEAVIAQAGLAEKISVDSAGTGDWHIGRQADRRTRAAAQRRGYDLDHLRARQVCAADFTRFAYILAMDAQNLADLQRMADDLQQQKMALYLPFCGNDEVSEVPDPYYGGGSGFDYVLDLVEAASDNLLAHIREQHNL